MQVLNNLETNLNLKNFNGYQHQIYKRFCLSVITNVFLLNLLYFFSVLTVIKLTIIFVN